MTKTQQSKRHRRHKRNAAGKNKHGSYMGRAIRNRALRFRNWEAVGAEEMERRRLEGTMNDTTDSDTTVCARCRRQMAQAPADD